jgi:hypothetical protein
MPRPLEREYWLTKKTSNYNSTPSDNKLKWVIWSYHKLLLTNFNHDVQKVCIFRLWDVVLYSWVICEIYRGLCWLRKVMHSAVLHLPFEVRVMDYFLGLCTTFSEWMYGVLHSLWK